MSGAKANAAAVPEVFLLNARRAVQGDINTINRAVSTLKTWGIPEADIQAVRDEAARHRIAVSTIGANRLGPGAIAPTLLLGYARMPEAAIAPGVRELTAVVRRVASAR